MPNGPRTETNGHGRNGKIRRRAARPSAPCPLRGDATTYPYTGRGTAVYRPAAVGEGSVASPNLPSECDIEEGVSRPRVIHGADVAAFVDALVAGVCPAVRRGR